MNDRELVDLLSQAKQGSAEAFAKIYTRYAQSIYYLALKITKNEHDAQDIVQETMYKVYKSLSTVRNGKALGAFINRTAYNTCISFVRDKVEFTADDDAIFNLQKESSVDALPEEYLASKEMQKTMANTVGELNTSHRTVIILYYYEKLSIKQIAELLSISQQAVKNRLFRAKENLKERLANSSLKGVVLFTVLFPAVGKALTTEANASFSPAVHTEIWTSLGNQIGLSASEISSTMSIAVVKQPVQPLSSITTARYLNPAFATGAKIVTGILVAGAVSAGVYVYNNTDKPPELEAYQSTAEYYGEIPPIKEPSSNGIDSPSSPPKDVELPKEVQPPAIPSPTTSSEQEILISAPTIFVENKTPLKYPVNKAVGYAQIVADAVVTISEGSTLKLIGFDDIKFNTLGEYAVYLQAVDENDNVSEMVALIIHIY